MAKTVRLLAIWIDQRKSFKIAKTYCDISYTERDFKTEKFHRKCTGWGDAKTFKLNFLAIKYKKAAFQKTLTRFWTANNGKYENVIIGAINLELLKGKTKVGKQGTTSVYLFIYLKLQNIKIKQRFREFNNLFSDI